jgi:hypothetical protein
MLHDENVAFKVSHFSIFLLVRPGETAEITDAQSVGLSLSLDRFCENEEIFPVLDTDNSRPSSDTASFRANGV